LKKTFSAESLRQSLEKNFFSQKPEEITRKKLFQPIASGNRLKKTFSAESLRKSLEKNFFSQLPEEIA